MTTFEDLKSQWGKQSKQDIPNNGAKLIAKKMNGVKTKQKITNVILVVTILILIGFFFYIEAYNVGLVSFALGLMITSLLIRVFIEYFSIKKLNTIDVTMSSSVYSEQLISYYKRRLQTHYIATPIIILAYSVGFIILLPFFKEYLSQGFYYYILISAVIVLFLMVFFISKQIKKELSILKEMQ